MNIKNPWKALRKEKINCIVYDTSGSDMNVKTANIHANPKRIIIPMKDNDILSTSDTEKRVVLFKSFFLFKVSWIVTRIMSVSTTVLKMMMRNIGIKKAARNGISSPIKQLYIYKWKEFYILYFQKKLTILCCCLCIV